MNKIFLLNDYGFISITGPDAETFLQGQLTCDVSKASETPFGAICTNKGRVLSVFRLFKIDEHYYLRLPKEILETSLDHLKKFSVFSKVELSESTDLIAIGISGEIPQTLVNSTGIIAEIPGDKRFEIYLPSQALEKITLDFSNNTQWRTQDIEQMLCQIHPETVDKFTPHDLNLHLVNAIDFDKGCYQGQEIIARMHYRGKLKQHLYRAHCKTLEAIAPYSPIVTEDNKEKSIGYLVDYSPTDKQVELLISTKEAALAKTCFIKTDQKLVVCELYPPTL